MLSLNTTIHVPGLSGREITDFLVNCDDTQYQAWWPGVHLQFHTVRRFPGDIGNIVYMDEYVGRFRIKGHAVATSAIPGREIVCQIKHGVRLPAWLILRFKDDARGVTISHTIAAGFAGPGRLLDPLLQLWFTPEFREAMDAHVRTEFPRLRDLLRGAAPA